MRRRVPVALLLALLAVVGHTRPAGAQTVLGRLVEAGTGQPLSGAFVVLLDSAGGTHGGYVTDEGGRFSVSVTAPGLYRVRAERIGHHSTLSRPLHLAPGDTLSLELTAAIQPVRLSRLDVKGSRRCVLRPQEGEATALLWDEARKALEIAAWTQHRGALQYRLQLHVRELKPGRLRVTRDSSWEKAGYQSGSPFVSQPPGDLAQNGYVRVQRDGSFRYFAPDAAVLLSDAFLDAHCFRVATKDPPSPGLVGLAFKPVHARLPDIQGVLWLDRSDAELRSLDFEYVHLRPPEAEGAARGRVVFERVPAGPWIVRDWYIRMPELVEQRVFGRREISVQRVREEGGTVVDVRRAGQSLLSRRVAAVEGTVWDSTRSAPLRHATVRLAGTGYRALTDDDGHFVLRAPPGRYALTLEHPRLASLPPLPDSAHDVLLEPGRAANVTLAIPRLSTLLAAACPGDHTPAGMAADSGPAGSRLPAPFSGQRRGPGARGAVLGTVRTADGRPAAAAIRIRWRGHGVTETIAADGHGRFLACDLPANTTVDVRATLGGQASATLQVMVPPDSLAAVDLVLDRDAAPQPTGARPSTAHR